MIVYLNVAEYLGLLITTIFIKSFFSFILMTKIYLETYGCTLNQSDTEVMSGLLKCAGFEIVDNLEDCDLCIINSCIVKGPTADKVEHRVRDVKKDKALILAGCMPQAEPDKFKDVSKIGTYQVKNIVDVVNATLEGHIVTLIAEGDDERLNLSKIRKNKYIEIIPISRGCLGKCTYCQTKKARGNLVSYPKQEILRQAEHAVRDGVKEIWITSQDCGAWGKDIGDNLPSLLRDLVKIEGDYMIRVGMMNPNHVLEFIDELIEVFMDKKIFEFFHIPLQAGNDKVLKLMKRKYSVEEFKELVTKLRATLKHCTIATDIICGFPGETMDHFKDTLDLISEIKPDVLNISRYWKRPGTPAARMKQLPPRVIKERSRQMTELFNKHAMDRNVDWLNWRGEVFISEKGSIDKSWKGRNFAYKPIVVLSEENLVGQTVNVKIIDIGKHDLKGKLI